EIGLTVGYFHSWCGQLITQPVVERQTRSHLPGIGEVPAPLRAALPAEAVELGLLAGARRNTKQEIRQATSCARRRDGVVREDSVEGKFPALRRRLEEVVLPAAHIRAELQRMPAFDVAEVVDVLERIDDVDKREE